MEFVDRSGRVRAKLYPPGKVTQYPHMHIYDSKRIPLDEGLKGGATNSPDVHIMTGGY